MVGKIIIFKELKIKSDLRTEIFSRKFSGFSNLIKIPIRLQKMFSLFFRGRFVRKISKTIPEKNFKIFQNPYKPELAFFVGFPISRKKIPIPWDFLKKSGLKSQKKSHGIEKSRDFREIPKNPKYEKNVRKWKKM